jgi:type II secretory pathway pseudopilin PulG
MRSERGVSLVEATVVLGVVAMLTAVLAPGVRGYVQTAQQSAARRDVEEIGAALVRMLADTGDLWVLRDGNGAAATDAPSHAASNRVDLLVSDGRVPGKYVARSSGAPDWDTAVNDTTVQKLEYFLVTNTPSNTSANAYRTAANMSVAGQFDPDDGATYNSPHAWRGAYLPGPIGADPWGNRYMANVEYLARAQGTGPSGNVNDVVVISAGSNGLIETRYDTDGPSSGNDILYVVSGGSR